MVALADRANRTVGFDERKPLRRAVVDRPSALAGDLQTELDIVDGGCDRANLQRFWTLPRLSRDSFEAHAAFTQKVWKTLRKSL
jgi:hypothetical protein